jgi:hypothetical protein
MALDAASGFRQWDAAIGAPAWAGAGVLESFDGI